MNIYRFDWNHRVVEQGEQFSIRMDDTRQSTAQFCIDGRVEPNTDYMFGSARLHITEVGDTTAQAIVYNDGLIRKGDEVRPYRDMSEI